MAIFFAALLFARRPGVMSFAFWLWAISELGGGDLDYALDWLPRSAGFIAMLLFYGLQFSGPALVSFALRFPRGAPSPRLRWLDFTVWAVLCAWFVFAVVEQVLNFAGRGSPSYESSQFVLAALPMVAAAGILLWKHARSDALERPRIAWASAAFVGAAVARGAAFVLSLSAADDSTWRFVIAVSNLLPLLAIYPILRYRLFDLGFVVNRAAVYSALSLSAFGTLAGVNWLAQHFVTERLAFIMQPVAAIAIGLGYFRIRHWAQSLIERVLFRERFATEAFLEATIRGLPFVERTESVDAVLVTDVTRALRLSSAALFRLAAHTFEREIASGWNGATLRHFPSDDALARGVIAVGPEVSLAALRWGEDGLPAAPNDPVLALGIVRRGVLSAIMLYGRHENGTELEPDEIRLIRRVGEAAAIAYETAEANTMRERITLLEHRLEKFEDAAARA